MPRTGVGQILRKSNRSPATTTFNSPGNYLPPYGSTVIRVGGRGASGNPNIPGNTVPGNSVPGNIVPGNISGHNPGSPGTISGHNPSIVENHNYGVWTGNAISYIQFFPGPPGPGPYTVNHTWTSYNPYPGFLAHSVPGPSGTGPFFFGDAEPPYGYGQTFQIYNVYQPGNFNGNPNFIPGNPNYNPYTPGHANFNPTTHNPTTHNPTTTNPTTPGNTGTPATILNVAFPGGPIGSTAPVVPQTVTTTVYTGSAISITVPSGGYVTIENV